MNDAEVHELVPGVFLNQVIAEHGLGPVLDYSTSLDDAFLALGRLACRKGWTFQIDKDCGYGSGPMFFCSIDNLINGRRCQAHSRYTNADEDLLDSLPLAICRACLLMVVVGVS